MTSHTQVAPMRRRTVLALAAASVVAACGGAAEDANDGRARVRLLNATADLDALDLLVNGGAAGQSVAPNAVGPYVAFDRDTVDLGAALAGSTSALATLEETLGRDSYGTLVAWGEDGAVRVSFLTENENENDIPDDTARLRVLNAAATAGTLDVYLTPAAADLDGVSANVAGAAPGVASSLVDIDPGVYRLRITAAGDNADLRLDVSGVSIDDGTVVTLVLNPGPGGVLVNALTLRQQGAVVAQANTQARVRLVASVAGNARLQATWGGISLGAVTAPGVGAYGSVAAGSQTLAVQVDGVTVQSAAETFEAGGDYSLVVWGAADAPAVLLLADDNRLPSSSARSRVRLVHLSADTPALTLTVDGAVIAQDLPAGAASAYGTVTASGTASVDVSSSLLVDPVFDLTETELLGLGVYSVFMLDGGSAVSGLLRRDR